MPKTRTKRMCNYDTRVWICEGHRPAYDSAAFATGVVLTESECMTLRSMVGRYYNQCRQRRIDEGNGEKYIVKGY